MGEVAKPTITTPRDGIVRITHCIICGSDLHMYAGELNKAMEKGDIMRHEAIGFVEKVGAQIRSLMAGDRVIILPVITCRKCDYCQQEEYSLWDRTTPSKMVEKIYGRRLSGIFDYSLDRWLSWRSSREPPRT